MKTIQMMVARELEVTGAELRGWAPSLSAPWLSQPPMVRHAPCMPWVHSNLFSAMATRRRVSLDYLRIKRNVVIVSSLIPPKDRLGKHNCFSYLIKGI